MSVLTEAISQKYFGLSERLGFGDQDRSDAEELITLIEEQLAFDPTYRPLRVLLAQALDDLGRLHQAGRANAEADVGSGASCVGISSQSR